MSLIEKELNVLLISNQNVSVYISLLIILCFFTPSAYSQKVFKLDKDTNQLSSEVPFDQYFYVDIEDPNGAIETFEVWSLFKVDGVIQDYKGKPEEFIPGVTKLNKRIHPPVGKKPASDLRVQRIKKTSRLIVPPLHPNRHFELMLINKFRGEVLQNFIKEVLHTFNARSEDQGVSAMTRLGKKIQPEASGVKKNLRTILGRYWYIEASKQKKIDSVIKIDSVFKAEANKFLKTFRSSYDRYMSVKKFHTIQQSSLSNSSFSLAAKTYKSLDESFAHFTNFGAIDFDDDFFQGLTTPNRDKKAEGDDYETRLNNLTSSKNSLKELIEALQDLRAYDLANKEVYKAMDKDLRAILTMISANIAFLKVENLTTERQLSLTDSSFSMAANVYKSLDKSFTLFAEFNSIDFDDNFFQGLTSPKKDKKAERHDLIMRLSYLANSEKNLKELIKALYRVRTHDVQNNSIYQNMTKDAQTILAAIGAKKTVLETEIKTIIVLLDKEKNMRYMTWVGGTNVITNLETISKRYIMPTIGLAYIDTQTDGPNFLKPFAGASFHLRAIDKNVPLKELSSNFWHRTTIFIGFTATKLNDDTKQYSDQNSTFSLMTGLNIKFSHAIGFSLGGIVLKRVDPNPTITKKQNVLSPYFGLTLDVDFAKQLSKLTSKGNL